MRGVKTLKSQMITHPHIHRPLLILLVAMKVAVNTHIMKMMNRVIPQVREMNKKVKNSL